MVKQETPLGTLVARRETRSNYSVILFFLQSGDNEKLVARVECDPQKREFLFQAWFDPDSGSASQRGFLSKAAIKQIFEEDEDDD